MKTLLIWAPIALKGPAVLWFSPVGSDNRRPSSGFYLLKTSTCAEPSIPLSPTPSPRHSDLNSLRAGAGLPNFSVSLQPTWRQQAELRTVEQRGQGSSFDLCVLLDFPKHQLHAGRRIFARVVALHWETHEQMTVIVFLFFHSAEHMESFNSRTIQGNPLVIWRQFTLCTN